MMESISLWIVLGIGFAAGNAVYWAAWAAEREIRERIRERREARTWYREARG